MPDPAQGPAPGSRPTPARPSARRLLLRGSGVSPAVASRPLLYRLARGISLAATVVLVVLILYLAATVYSVSKARPGGGSGSAAQESFADGVLEVTYALNFSNPGFLPIRGVELASVVDAPNNTSRLAIASSPDVALGPGATARIPISLDIPLDANPALEPLLTRDAELPTGVWANVTASSFFSISVNVTTLTRWGAPFAHLDLAPGPPTSDGGAVAEPFALSFDNDAIFALNGTLRLTASGTGGCTASIPPVDLDVASETAFAQTVPATIPAACADATWNSFGGGYAESGWNVTIPPEALP